MHAFGNLFLLSDLFVASMACIFFVYFGTQQDDDRWFGSAWQRALRGVTSVGPLSLLLGWAGSATAAGVSACLFEGGYGARDNRTSIGSVTKLLADLGIIGGAISVALVLVLVLVRFILCP
jgi:hypothetical protein